MKKFTSLAMALALALGLAACSTGNQNGTTSVAPESQPQNSIVETVAPADGVARPTADRAGNPIQVPEIITSAVSMTPATTQILLDLGLGDTLVAVDEESALLFPSLNDRVILSLYSPNVEEVMLLQPDIIFTAEMNTEGAGNPFAQLEGEDICVAYIPTATSVQAIYEDIGFFAACYGLQEEAETLMMECQLVLDELSAIAVEIDTPKTVLFEIAALPYIYSFGEGTYLNELLEIIGAENVLAGQSGFLPVEEEAAVALNPDVILTNVTYIEDSVDEILARQGWENVAAIQNGEVYFIDNAASSLPNHHIAEAALQMAQVIYPEYFAGA